MKINLQNFNYFILVDLVDNSSPPYCRTILWYTESRSLHVLFYYKINNIRMFGLLR
jgi:hypothetical protein